MCLAVPGRILTIAEVDGARMADVDFGGVTRDQFAAARFDLGGERGIVHAKQQHALAGLDAQLVGARRRVANLLGPAR